MTTVDVRSVAGGTKGSVELDAAVFGITPNVAVMHQVVTAQLAARRAGTQSTKTRAEVSGGGAKPWRQKGTGRARQGSTRSPHWVGGGVTHAPKPRSYAQRTPKKMIRLALLSALSDRAADGKVVVVDAWDIDAPSTKAAVKALDSLGITGRALVVLADGDEAVWKSLRNLGNVHCILARELNAYDVLVSDYVVFSRETLPTSAPSPAEAGSGADDSTPVTIAKAGDEA
jgi:large subunit ribosomal protein L4